MVNDQELVAVSALEGQERYEHFVKRICDTERVYMYVGREDEETVLVIEDGGKRCMPFWPHPRYAEAYTGASEHTYTLAEVDLTEFVDAALPDLAKDGLLVAVMPTDRRGRLLTVPADDLARSIVAYHEEWFGGWPKYSRLDARGEND